MLPSLDYPYFELDIEQGEIWKPWLIKEEITIFICTNSLAQKMQTIGNKIRVLATWNNDRARGTRQPVDISMK